ncbi:hypothetical protein J2S40_004366 [Nocardioides luteus]|uniref:DUF3592 domain-containing protein n=1 Tax=Nocardioides luteus TaxID=1844 RepID=A0ABQ5SQE8_9ACTN|nr:DUF3592 domain-containing protein [Nocardioides luteus]MDR7313308.1 hypothetical protein [Nocardioides luteus]GGR60141.1 hypothetical protein GCM10010197_28710 [Nocardioides luteus]GLJ66373.1 hypothetical protein GCM10017579_04090 [Nocardioides luteus]
MESLSLVIFGVCLALTLPVALIMTVRTWSRRRTWAHVEGTVTSVKTKRQTSGNTQTTVRYQYVDSSGQQRTGTDTPWFREPKRNSKIAVMYNPEQPEISEASSMTWLYLLLVFSVVVFVIGGVLVVSGLGL